MPVTFRAAEREDLEQILHVQHEAFSRVAAELSIPVENLPPLHESHHALLALHDDGARFFCACDGATIVGGVRATRNGDTVEVGRLVVAEGYLRQGIATGLMQTLEAAFPSARRFELFTGADAKAPLALYGSLGYRVVRRASEHDVPLVWLAKERADAP